MDENSPQAQTPLRKDGRAPASNPGQPAAVVRVDCRWGQPGKSIIGYGRTSAEAYENAIAQAEAYCRDRGGTKKITKL